MTKGVHKASIFKKMQRAIHLKRYSCAYLEMITSRLYSYLSNVCIFGSMLYVCTCSMLGALANLTAERILRLATRFKKKIRSYYFLQ